MRESKVEQYFCDTVERLGGWTRKLAYQGRVGAPDRLVLFERYHCAVELKAPGKEARGEQSREHRLLQFAGFDVDTLDTIEKVDVWAKNIESKLL